MKKILSLILFCLFVTNITATDSYFQTEENRKLEHAKEFFHNKNYSAAYRYTEELLAEGIEEVEEKREAEYISASRFSSTSSMPSASNSSVYL